MIILSHRYHFLNFMIKWFTLFGMFCDRAWLQNPHFSPLHLIKILSPFNTLCQRHAFESIFLWLSYTLFWFLLPLSIIVSLLLFPIFFLIPNLGIPEIIPPPTLILWRFGSACPRSAPTAHAASLVIVLIRLPIICLHPHVYITWKQPRVWEEYLTHRCLQTSLSGNYPSELCIKEYGSLGDVLSTKALLSSLLGGLWVMDKVGDAKSWEQDPLLSSQREREQSSPS